MNGLLKGAKDVLTVANYMASVSIEEEKEMLENLKAEEEVVVEVDTKEEEKEMVNVKEVVKVVVEEKKQDVVEVIQNKLRKHNEANEKLQRTIRKTKEALANRELTKEGEERILAAIGVKVAELGEEFKTIQEEAEAVKKEMKEEVEVAVEVEEKEGGETMVQGILFDFEVEEVVVEEEELTKEEEEEMIAILEEKFTELNAEYDRVSKKAEVLKEKVRKTKYGREYAERIIGAVNYKVDFKVEAGEMSKMASTDAKIEALKEELAVWALKGNDNGYEGSVVVALQEEVIRLETSMKEEDILVGMREELLEVFDAIEHNPFMISFLGGAVAMAGFTEDKKKVLMYDDYFLGLNEETRRFVLLHEMAHIINGDLDGIVAGKQTGLIRNDRIEFAADAFAANVVGEKAAIHALMDITAVVMGLDDQGVTFIAKQVNESIAELRRRAQKIAGVKLEEKKVGNIMNKTVNNVKGFFGLGVAAGAPNSVVEIKEVEVKLEGGEAMKQEALVVKNKVEASNILYINEGGFVDDAYSIGATPIINLGLEMQQLQMASLQDFNDKKLMEKDKLAKMLVYLVDNVDSSYAKTLLKKEVEVIDGLKGILADLRGVGAELVYGTLNHVQLDEYVGNKLNEFIKFKPGFAGPGHKRQGLHGLLGESTSYLAYVTSLGLDLESFNGTEFNLKKIGTRVLLSGSSVALVPMFDGFTHKATVQGKTYDYLGGQIESTAYVLSNGHEEINIEVIPEDFTVQMTEAIKGSVFDGDEVGFEEFETEIDKLATDGAAFFDPAVAKRAGLEHAFTFRFAQLAKGLGVIVPELSERLGSDIIFFGGSVKADITPYIERNQLDFGVIMHARLHDSKLLPLSRQAAKRCLDKDTFAYFAKRTDSIIKGVIDLDMDVVSAFLSVGVGLDEEEMEVVAPTDIQITHLFHANPELVLGEAVLRKRLRTFLYAQLEKYANGESIIVEEGVWRHMVVDPYAIVRFLEAGMMSVKAEDVAFGIRRNHTLTVNNKTKETESKEALLIRFPITHEDEARVVNREKGGVFAEGGSFSYYNKYAEYFRGLIVFSLLDLNPEAMGGADFDGDTCFVWTLKMVVEASKEHKPFLDFSMVNGKLVSGAPFEDVRPVDYVFLTEQDKEVMKSEGVVFTETGKASVAGNLTDEVKELLWKVVAYISMQTLEPGFVGLLTNISDTVVEFMTTVEDSEKLEKLDRLNNFLTVAIRWEIDKTKHGGAFYDELPFLKLLLGMEEPSEKQIKRFERKFGVILAPFFYEKKGNIKSWTSKSLYYTYDASKETKTPRLMVNSVEHGAILKHRQLMEGIAHANNNERSHFNNLVAYARDVMAEGFRAGVITEEIVKWFSYERAQNASPVHHPVALVIRANKAIASLYQERNQYAMLGESDSVELCNKKIKEVKEAAIALGSSYDMLEDKYIFALTYYSVAKRQSTLAGRKEEFLMTYANAVFNYLAKQSVAFLSAVDVKGIKGNVENEVSFKTNATDVKVGDVLNIKYGAFDGGRVDIESTFKNGFNGTFVVSKVAVSKSAHVNGSLIVYGRFVNNDTPKGGEDMKQVEELGQEYVDFEMELRLQDWDARELVEVEEISVEVLVDSVDEEFIPSAEVTSLNSSSSITEVNSVVLDLFSKNVDSQYMIHIDGCDYAIELKDIITIQDSIEKHFDELSENVYRQLFMIGVRRLFNLHTGNTTVLK